MDVAAIERLVAGVGGYVFAVVLGTLWGSFANVCIYRWPPTDDHPKGRSVVKPASHCPECKVPIKWYDNIPLLGFVWLRGRCRACKARFSPRYLLVEAVTGALFGVAWWAAYDARLVDSFDDRMLRFAIYAGFAFVMVVITFIDLDHMLILDKITLPSIVVFYLCSLALGQPWWHGVVGAAVGWGVITAVFYVYLWLTKRQGLGGGDGKLLAVVGALLGWKGVVAALFGGSLLGSVIGITAIAIRRSRARGTEKTDAGDGEAESIRHVELPFGPYLAMAALFYLFAEPYLVIRFSPGL